MLSQLYDGRSQRPSPDDPPVVPGFSRRSLLRAGALGGGASVAVAAGTAMGASAAASPSPSPSASASSPMQDLFTLSDLDFETLFAFGGIGYGCGEFGELVTVVNQVNGAGASYQSYFEGFWALARRTEALADGEAAAGHRAAARGAYLRASTYYAMCLYFILGTTAAAGEAGAYAACQRCFQGASRLSGWPFEPVRIPYAGTWLPGYLLRPGGRPARRPTVILNNGQDGQHVALYPMAVDALERGYNALLFYGPGQGGMLFERQVPFRHDWESVITPVVDYLRSRPEVDPGRIVLNGTSLGGELVIRAAAFERRLAAVVADPGFLSPWLAWQANFPPIASLLAAGAGRQEVNAAWQDKVIPALGPVGSFEVAKTSEGYGEQFLRAARAGQVFTDMYDFATTIMKFTVADVASQVTTPALVTVYEGDALVIPPAEQGAVVYALLPGHKQLHHFTAANGAQYHCAPMAPQAHNQVIYDWLDDVL